MFNLLRKWKSGNFRSGEYWDRRYRDGGTSGAGSYGRLAEFKAEILNAFVTENGVKTVVEHGCGDGAQLELAKYPEYVGLDVSPTIIETCRKRFEGDASKQFHVSGADVGTHDLALSLDVVYHLVEDAVYLQYMQRLLGSSHRFVAVYASNYDKWAKATHVRHRRFTDAIAEAGQWSLIKYVPNRYPFDRQNKNETSFADFYFFERSAD
ncbi:class I SAM-dependent methyltransferase [Aminobacter sp. BE322]|uniref:class I SAM-dependent methyltransferase n=1 Tax=unclassified Aminobacter TaxID=2644704 RepID=UPI003D1A5946